MLTLKFKRLTSTMTIPTKAHPTDACFDLYADIQNETGSLLICPHQTVKVNTGFATNIPAGYWCPIYARSGLASKQGLRPAQGVAVIDEPYTGEWLIPIHNDSEQVQEVRNGDRIAQFMLLPYFDTELIEVNELDSTDRGDGGFGSTGK